MVRLTDRPDMTLDFYRGRKTTIQQQQQPFETVFQSISDIHVIIPGSSGRLPEMGLTSRAPGKDAKPPGS